MDNEALPSWSRYQEDVAQFFRALGLTANTNVRLSGIRTSHDVDVLVTTPFAGIPVKWVVECKEWKNRVSKNQVLGLRSIVDDVGADRGFIMAENGFQSGAFEAAQSCNISLTNIKNLSDSAQKHLTHYRIEQLGSRFDHLSELLGKMTIKTHSTATSFISRSIQGAGLLVELHGHLGMAEHGLKQARLGQLPATYGFLAGGDTSRRAQTLLELLDGLEEIADSLAADLTEREKSIRKGLEAHLY